MKIEYEQKLLEETPQTFSKKSRIYFTIAYQNSGGGWTETFRGKSPTDVIEKTQNKLRLIEDRKYRIFKYVVDETKVAVMEIIT